MQGTNEIMYYLAKYGSYCEMHCEDGDLPSVNILRCFIPAGRPFGDTNETDLALEMPGPTSRRHQRKIGKIWLVVFDKQGMLNALHRELQNRAHFSHKVVVLTLDFLKLQMEQRVKAVRRRTLPVKRWPATTARLMLIESGPSYIATSVRHTCCTGLSTVKPNNTRCY